MSVQPESRVVRRILNFLRSRYPGWWRKIHGGAFQSRGIPDIIGCHKGQFISIEVKVPGNKPSELQKLNGEEIIQAGGLWLVAYSVEDVAKAMRYHFKE